MSLFAKAQNMAARGLEQRKITDKNGRVQTRWIRREEAPKLRRRAKAKPPTKLRARIREDTSEAKPSKTPTKTRTGAQEAPSAASEQDKTPVGHESHPDTPQYEPKEGEEPKAFLSRMVQEHKEHLDMLKDEYGAHTLEGHAVITMGLPGSGKSHYLNNHHMRHGQYLHVDVDALKKLHPEYDPKAPEKVHGFSKDLEMHLYKEAIQNKVPVSLDTTGGNHKKWAKRMQELRKMGYHHIGLSYVKVDPETSRARNQARERSVPDEVINGTLAEFQREHPDNDGSTPFEHLSKHADKVHVLDHEDEKRKANKAQAAWKAYTDAEKKIKERAQTFGKAVGNRVRLVLKLGRRHL